MFSILIYKSKGVCQISSIHLNILQRGNFMETTEKLTEKPQIQNLIIDLLPPEILMTICEYLAPGDFVRLGLTCCYFQEIFNDQETWRRIAKSYQQFFIFDYFEPNTRITDQKIIGFQTLIEQEMELISIQKQDPKFPNLSKKHFKSMDKSREKRMKKYFHNNKIDNSSVQDQNSSYSGVRKPILASTKKQRIDYINSLENPKEEMLAKGRKIDKTFKERKIKEERKQKNKKKEESREKVENILLNHLNIIGFIFSVACLIYSILLTVRIEGGMNTKLSIMNLSVLIPLFFLTFLIGLSLYYRIVVRHYCIDETVFFFGIVLLFFIQIILIGLRVDDFIKCSWCAIFIPFFVLFVFVPSFFIYDAIYGKGDSADAVAPVSFAIDLIIFFIFLGLRIDGKIHWNYGLVFTPLLAYLLIFFVSSCFLGFPSIGLAVTFFASIFFLFLILYLESISIHHIYYPFIEVYLLCVIGGAVSCFITS
ncbi:dactylin [Anaeramoeba ignava]|uniref:Dactylin n=1 Tax=Anaeramoeba ignava TaxID=1746090 RepID=A0A9Q0RBB9_ANAIG|nr:dactylin [Anaeramoeba ignava]